MAYIGIIDWDVYYSQIINNIWYEYFYFTQMVRQLAVSGANNIWEYTLLDPTQNRTGRRKPNPRDQIQ